MAAQTPRPLTPTPTLAMLLAIIYLAFIGLGLPDSLLGSAWPVMYKELGTSLSAAGVISAITTAGTIVSSLLSDRMTRRLGTGLVTAVSVSLTAAALFGFSCSRTLAALCLWAVPYGLGAGGVDAALNNYVALHYTSRHMNWLHCMWGVGASLGPCILGCALTSGHGWSAGCRMLALLLFTLTALLFLSLPLWAAARNGKSTAGDNAGKPLPLRAILRIPGAAEAMACFFFYCALEQTAGLWAGSYLVLSRGVTAETAAVYVGVFFAGITVGRLLSGFLSIRLSDKTMVRLGLAVAALGLVLLLLPLGRAAAAVALAALGLGCAPVYPSLLHATPARFGADTSQAVIGMQMASSYVGACLMPPLFGLLAEAAGAMWLPVCLGAALAALIALHESMLTHTYRRKQDDK